MSSWYKQHHHIFKPYTLNCPTLRDWVDETYTAITTNENFVDFYGEFVRDFDLMFQPLRSDLKRKATGYMKPPYNLWFLESKWNIDDFHIQLYVNLIIWGICPFDEFSVCHDPAIGLDEDGRPVLTLQLPAVVRPGVVKDVLYVPSYRRDQVVLYHFYVKENYGIGADKMYSVIKEKYFHLSLRNVRRAIALTQEYQLHARIPGGVQTAGIVNHPNITSTPCKRVQLDTAFLKQQTDTNHNAILTMVDTCSKKGWAWAAKASSEGGGLTSAQAWKLAGNDIKKLAQAATAANSTLYIQTDAGSEFMKDFNEGLKQLRDDPVHPVRVVHVSSVSNMSRRTGAIEAFNKTIKRMIFEGFTHQGKEGKGRWVDQLPKMLERYNSTVHSATQYTPNELHELRGTDELMQLALQNTRERASHWLQDNDKMISKAQWHIEPGDFVRRRLTKRIMKELAEKQDEHEKKGVNAQLGMNYTMHSWSKRFTVQIYQVLKIHNRTGDLQRKQDSKVSVQCTLLKVRPYIGIKEANPPKKTLILVDYLSNLLKIGDLLFSRSTFNTAAFTTDLNEPSYEPRATMPKVDASLVTVRNIIIQPHVPEGYHIPNWTHRPVLIAPDNESAFYRKQYEHYLIDIAKERHEAGLDKPDIQDINDDPLDEDMTDVQEEQERQLRAQEEQAVKASRRKGPPQTRTQPSRAVKHLPPPPPSPPKHIPISTRRKKVINNQMEEPQPPVSEPFTPPSSPEKRPKSPSPPVSEPFTPPSSPAKETTVPQPPKDLVLRIEAEFNRNIVSSATGWVTKPNAGGGNCFYLSITQGFNDIHFMGRANWTAEELRGRNTGLKGEDLKKDSGRWVTASEVCNIVMVYPFVLALAIFQRPESAIKYRYYFKRTVRDANSGKQEEKLSETIISKSVPMNLCIVRVAFTGDHYMAITKEPENKHPTHIEANKPL